ncbi:MAG: hypothetical protein ACJAS9_001198 [Polaribacter sp.]
MFFRSIRGQFFLAFFFLGLSNVNADNLDDALQAANENQLFKHKTWKALLHLKDGKPQIIDPKFLLSAGSFSLKAELAKTIELFYLLPNATACRFPARLIFLQEYIPLLKRLKSTQTSCTEYIKFKEHVPFDHLSLVFASEVLSSATSMMGHTFLKASGKNLNGKEVAHSIAFFTEIKTFNPFKLIYKGLFSGMEGFIVVKKFEDDLKQYTDTEGRNLWSYTLAITPINKALIQAHIWELKNIEITYLFQNYNCATLTLYLLSIANEELRKSEKLYVSPLDIAKAINTHKMVKEKEVFLATDWELKMLEEEMSSSLFRQVKEMIFDDIPLNTASLSKKSKFLIKRFLSLILKKENLFKKLERNKKMKILKLVEQLEQFNFHLDVTQYKNPIHSLQDSVISTNLLYQANNIMFEMGFLPASHYIYSNNTQYFSESELRIGEIKLRADLKKAKLRVQSFTFYSVNLYTPGSIISSHLSGGFYLGYRHLFDHDLKEQGVFEFSGAVGKSYKLHKDILFYGMLGLGIAVNKDDSFAYLEPYIGTTINLLAGSKAVIEYKLSNGQFDIPGFKKTFSLDYAWSSFGDTTFKLGIKSNSIDNVRVNQISLTWNQHF